MSGFQMYTPEGHLKTFIDSDIWIQN